MAKRRPDVDVWDLFVDGHSGGIKFGTMGVDEVRRGLGVRSRGWEGRLPFSSWFLDAADCELAFQGLPPRLYSFKVKASARSLSREATNLLEGDSASFEQAGINSVLMCGQPLSRFSTMRTLFENFPPARRLSLRPTFDKAVTFELNERGRSLALGYRLAFREMDSSIFDADYFLYAVWVQDHAVDAELSKTLPEGSGDRFSEIAKVANAGKVS
ncbi:hypothetical protein [Bosea sp. BK604]|uniref:hypothetical protein n=1 Tax=Bosea sp. BK604 TaxID=2512180 RepID=UPI00104ACFEE|nr:hypothetical protein [Bosea sp. BK604]